MVARQQEAFVRHYVTHCCNQDGEPSDPSEHIAQNHVNDVLNDIRVAFSRHKHPSLDKRFRAKYADPRLDSEHLENQTWKVEKNGFDKAAMVEWVVSACPVSIILSLERKNLLNLGHAGRCAA